MATSKNLSNAVGTIVGLLVLGLVIFAIVSYLQPDLFKAKSEGFKGTLSAASNTSAEAGQNATPGPVATEEVKGNPNVEDTPSGPADFGSADSPSGCYPRDQLTPSELLPKDSNSTWAEQNPMGNGSLKGKNFLSAGALIGVNTVGQSLRNANQQIRSEPPNPQVPVSIFSNTTIEPDVNRRNLEIA